MRLSQRSTELEEAQLLGITGRENSEEGNLNTGREGGGRENLEVRSSVRCPSFEDCLHD